MPDDLHINNLVTIPAAELEITASRSSGPGGQHVNKTDTRITVRWNLPGSVALSDFQRDRVRRHLQTRLTDEGDLLIHCDSHRSQRRNREEALQRLAALVREALIPPKARKRTKPTAASRRRRLDNKKRRSEVKKGRGRKYDGSDG